MKKLILFFVFAFAVLSIYAQEGKNKVKKDFDEQTWYLSCQADGLAGINLDKAYEFLRLKNKTSKKIIVAVIDSGVDIDHEDLKDNIWVNKDEIPDNGIDDDNNGFIDDINGWNFIGGPDGRNIEAENSEATRFIVANMDKFDAKAKSQIEADDMEDYLLFLELKENYDNSLAEAKEMIGYLGTMLENADFCQQYFNEKLGLDSALISDVKVFKAKTDREKDVKEAYMYIFDDFGYADLIEVIGYFQNDLDFSLNLDLDVRQDIVGDEPHNWNDSIYGNNDAKGIGNSHGTHVAGTIGAVRDNNIGINGIADNVEIMVIRTVPDGDERDKDVANSILYAVRNGADVINCSFGKAYSSDPEFLDKAIKEAEARGVLIIHAAGNEATDNDQVTHVPTSTTSYGYTANNWLIVGASSYASNKYLPASFSNYGKTTVDVFAPGVQIYSTVPDNKYEKYSGTSMASPVVSGVAALIKSYYPSLTATQIRDIIMKSVEDYSENKVFLPFEGEKRKEKVVFGDLSVSGGVVNVYKAVLLAEEMVTE